MSILGAVYYDRFEDNHRTPEWFRAERYDYCEGTEVKTTEKKRGVFGLMFATLTALF